VLVRFRRPPALYASAAPPANYVRFRISPDVAIALGAMVKAPGEAAEGRPVELVAVHHPDAAEMDAYERLLGDAMKGNATEFAREDSVEEAWRIVDPVLGPGTPVVEYDPHTWGPAEAAALTSWHDPVTTGTPAEPAEVRP
jgi:glucose-6-phosphate 1-dehydrogenase